MAADIFTPMDVDSEEKPADIDLLRRSNIYNTDEFPLEVRVYMEPIIREYRLYEHCLDFDSCEPEIIDSVDRICEEALLKFITKLDIMSRCSSEYVSVPNVRYFIDECRRTSNKELFIRLQKKLEIEKQLTAMNDDGRVDNSIFEINEQHKRVQLTIEELVKTRNNQISLISKLDNYLRNLTYNRDMIRSKRQEKLPDEEKAKIALQKSQYMSCIKEFEHNLDNDLKFQSTKILELPQLIVGFITTCKMNMMQIRIYQRKTLEALLNHLRSLFSTTKDDIRKAIQIITVYYQKLHLVQQNHRVIELKYTEADLKPLKDAERLLIESSVVVAEEPSFSARCLKRDKKLNSFELMLLLDKVTVENHCLRAHLLTENGLRRINAALQRHDIPIVTENDRGGTLKGDTASIDPDVIKGTVKFSFKDLTITCASRKHKQNEAVTQQKHVVLFAGEITIDGVNVNPHCFSLPVIVSVHGNQTSKSLATIFWDDNFPAVNRTGLDVRPYVSWKEMSEAICNLFRLEVDREPTPSNLQYMKERLYGDTPPTNKDISFEMFAKMSVKYPRLSFWEWLWGTIQLLVGDKTLLRLWIDGYIVGYIGQHRAKEILKDFQDGIHKGVCGPDTERLFLIRFSESQKELITIQGHLHDNKKGWGIFSVNPYRAADLKSISLSTRILDRYDCQKLLYEDPKTNEWIKIPKEEVFQKESSCDDQASLPYGYISWTLKERTDIKDDLSNYRVQADDEIFSPTSNDESTIFNDNMDLLKWLAEDDNEDPPLASAYVYPNNSMDG